MKPGADSLAPYDYVVVGAGSAGCVLASRLASTARRVLVLEAGGSDRRWWIRVPIGYGRTYFDPRVNWCYTSAPSPELGNRASYWPRGKVVGGSSSINAMVYYRGQPHDFDDWARAAGDAWSWPAVRGAFEAIERCTRADGSVTGDGALWITDPGPAYHPLGEHYLRAAGALGFQANPHMIGGDGVGRYCITARGGRRCSAADAFLRPALASGNVNLLSDAHALRLLFDGRRATGVEFLLRGSTHRVYCREEVVVSAGAVNSPQLLQLSGIGPRALLARHGITTRADLPAVGGNLQDHLAVTYFYRSRVPTLNNELHPWWGKALAGARYLALHSGPLALGVNQYGGFVRAAPGTGHPDIQVYFNPVTYQKTPVGKRPLLSPDPYPGFILSFQPCRPLSRGRIDIVSADPSTPPAIMPAYLSDPRDFDTVVHGGRLMARLARTDAMCDIIAAPIGPTPEQMSDNEIVEDFRARADTVYHPVGTCAMGRDAASSVVDAELRVHGIEGLRVADASVFANITSGNTNAAALMVGWRAAELILADGDGRRRN